MIRHHFTEWAVYLCTQPIDFRKGMASLAVMVETALVLNPFDQALYVFSNRNRSAIKILYWDKNGFCLWQKRLEQDRFRWPKPDSKGTLTVSLDQLGWLLEGYDISLMKPHKSLNYQSVT
jgi:transposase